MSHQEQPDLLATVRSNVEALKERVDLENVRESIQSVSQKIEQKLPEIIKSVRERGYEYGAKLDEAADDLESRWDTLKRELESRVKNESQELRQHFETLRMQIKNALDQADDEEKEAESTSRRLKLDRETDADDEPEEKGSRLAGKLRANREPEETPEVSSSRRLKISSEAEDDEKGNSILDKVQRNLNRLEQRLESVESEIEEAIQDFTDKEYELSREVSTIDFYLKQFEEAGFSLESGEALVMAAKAEWVQSGKGNEDPDGVLYLTNRRLIFEQKEKVNKRFGLFGGQQVQDVVWEFPVSAVTQVEHENRGMLGGKDMIHISVSEGAPAPVITVEVKGGSDNVAWVKCINQVVSGEIEEERI